MQTEAETQTSTCDVFDRKSCVCNPGETATRNGRHIIRHTSNERYMKHRATDAACKHHLLRLLLVVLLHCTLVLLLQEGMVVHCMLLLLPEQRCLLVYFLQGHAGQRNCTAMRCTGAGPEALHHRPGNPLRRPCRHVSGKPFLR